MLGRGGNGVERRQFARRVCAVRATAMVPGQPAIGCTVSDVSEGGARVELDAALAVGRSIVLLLDGSALQLAAEVCHRRATSMGVRFTQDGAGAALIEHVRRSGGFAREIGNGPAAASRPTHDAAGPSTIQVTPCGQGIL
jgi:PilZ domain